MLLEFVRSTHVDEDCRRVTISEHLFGSPRAYGRHTAHEAPVEDDREQPEHGAQGQGYSSDCGWRGGHDSLLSIHAGGKIVVPPSGASLTVDYFPLSNWLRVQASLLNMNQPPRSRWSAK